MSEEDDLDAWRAKASRDMEQMEASAESLARAVSIFYHTLVKQGVPQGAAESLTSSWVMTAFQRNP